MEWQAKDVNGEVLRIGDRVCITGTVVSVRQPHIIVREPEKPAEGEAFTEVALPPEMVIRMDSTDKRD